MDANQSTVLRRGLKNRHVQFIALGGSIGSGLFLGSASAIQSCGPSIIFGYAISGFFAFLIMRQLGEMAVEEPVSGSFSYFSYRYWGKLSGFISGWNYWLLYIFVAMVELTAVGKFMQFWYPDIPTWVPEIVFFLAINAINLANVKLYGEVEFYLTIIKVVAVIGMILFGLWLLVNSDGGTGSSVSNLWNHGGFLAHGIHGLAVTMATIIFSFGGLELVGIIAAETEDPETSIPRATNQVVYRILIFYILSFAVLLSLIPWTQISDDVSPFVLVFHDLGDELVANILNMVILTAALSVYNSCVYCDSRILLSLSQQGNAPKIFSKIDNRGVPVAAILLSASATAICVLINIIIPDKAFHFLLSLVVSAQVINWAMISLVHIKFRRKKDEQGIVTKFRSPIFPISNYLCLLFLVGIVVAMLATPAMAISVWLIPIWLIVLALSFLIKMKYSR
jgi:aromatic amino acid transport protein AroP